MTGPQAFQQAQREFNRELYPESGPRNNDVPMELLRLPTTADVKKVFAETGKLYGDPANTPNSDFKRENQDVAVDDDSLEVHFLDRIEVFPVQHGGSAKKESAAWRKLRKKVPADRRAKSVAELVWVKNNIGNSPSELVADDVPSRAAMVILMHAWKNPDWFMEKVWKPKAGELEDEEKKKTSDEIVEVLETITKLKCESMEEVQRETEAAASA